MIIEPKPNVVYSTITETDDEFRFYNTYKDAAGAVVHTVSINKIVPDKMKEIVEVLKTLFPLNARIQAL